MPSCFNGLVSFCFLIVKQNGWCHMQWFAFYGQQTVDNCTQTVPTWCHKAWKRKRGEFAHIYFAIFSIRLTGGKSPKASEFALFSQSFYLWPRLPSVSPQRLWLLLPLLPPCPDLPCLPLVTLLSNAIWWHHGGPKQPALRYDLSVW